ncbi:hypothetical protein IGK74_000121 [Enterococcus sp. AZ150]|uniref:CotH kinase family protein n=1 Tax=Enterococcus sp. AZ150 TaxID=2774866 RepID=UPI003F211242
MKKIKTYLVSTALLTLLLAGCSVQGTTSTSSSTTKTNTTTVSTTNDTTTTENTFFTDDSVHTIAIDVNDDDYQAALTAYKEDGKKKWISATVTIDGQKFENVGIKLKGNSTLRNALSSGQGIKNGEVTTDSNTTSTVNPEELPWIIRLDKYVDGQSYSGRTDFVIRGNNSETSLNEAVALSMLSDADIPTEQSAFTKVSFNGSTQALRLVIDTPDDDLWTEEHFGTNVLVYKADADGDYSYRGEDASSYTDVFDQKYGDDDMTPMINFLKFINEASDEDFANKLADYVDVDEFATYLAMQDIVGNDDDIDGPGNNAYWVYDKDTKKFQIIAWDQNLSFGGMGQNGPGGGGQMGQMNDDDQGNTQMGTPPDGAPSGQTAPNGQTPPDQTDTQTQTDDQTDTKTQRSGMNKENPLTEKFRANSTFAALIEEKKTELIALLVTSGDAAKIVSEDQALLEKEASDLVDQSTIQSEASSITTYLTSLK